MTGEEFITYVKLKLNKLDTSSYEEVRPEEVLFFGTEAIKRLTLDFDIEKFSPALDREAMLNYLASLTEHKAEQNLTSGSIDLEKMLKLKDVSVHVKIGEEEGWQPTRFMDNNMTTDREDNPFMQSYPDTPTFRLISNKLSFDPVAGCTFDMVKYDYLTYPEDLAEDTEINFPFTMELEDLTVTLLLEDLESRRIQSQPLISKS